MAWLLPFKCRLVLIHFNDIILENKNMHGISSIVRKEELFPFANLAIISLICSQFFLPERLYKQLIFLGGGGHIRDFLLSITEK